jgi:GNAT superfamily N-acetyltransferase
MEQGVFALRQVESVRAPPGSPRAAGPSDGAIIGRWLADFAAEALPDEPRDEERMHQALARRLSGEGPGAYWVWEWAGEPMSLSGHGNPTGSGIRIGPVYTPKRLRGRGYASALVAA